MTQDDFEMSGSPATTDFVDMQRAQTARVDHALREAVNTGRSVKCEVYGVMIDVVPTDYSKDIKDIIREKTGN